MNAVRKPCIRPVDFKRGVVDLSHGSGGRAMAPDIEHTPVANHRHRLGCHGDASLSFAYGTGSYTVGLSMPGDQGKKMRSTATMIWNSTIPMIDRMIRAPQASWTLKKAVEVWIR